MSQFFDNPNKKPGDLKRLDFINTPKSRIQLNRDDPFVDRNI